MSSEIQVNKEILSKFLENLLNRQLESSASEWFASKLSQLQKDHKTRDLFLTFSAIPRFLGNQPLNLSEEDKQQAQEIRSGLSLEEWTLSQAARVLTITSFPHDSPEGYLKILDQIFSTAEVNELVALYSALPLLPYPEKLQARAAEGVRTNMSVVFDSVVLNNPYPCDYLDESAWNQMVLKALFMERPLYKIYGLENRSNDQLSKMISNYAHERWAAGRTTSPEMWRPIGNHGIISIYQDLEQLIGMEDPDQQAAAVLTALALKTKEAQIFLDHHEPVVTRVKNDSTTWNQLGERWWTSKNLN